MAGTCGYDEGLSGSINSGNFLTSCKVYWLASQEGLCSMEEVIKITCKIKVISEEKSRRWSRQLFIVLFDFQKR
jgi:hypothetical protein